MFNNSSSAAHGSAANNFAADDDLDFLLDNDVQQHLNVYRNEADHAKLKKHKYHVTHRATNSLAQDVVTHKKRTDKVYLDVISVVSNPVEFQTRYRLFKEFCVRMRREPQVRLLTIELQQGNKPFATDANIKLRTNDELWHKENLINIATTYLPADWEYMAWIDADIEFQRKDWVEQTIRELQHYDIVQLFSHAIDMGPNGEINEIHTGFCYKWQLYQIEEEVEKKEGIYKQYGHPGYAFAIRREMYNALGGLIEFAIIGAGDYHQCNAWIGQVNVSYVPDVHPNYKTLCDNYQKRCDRHLKRNIGFVYGTVLHYWHGKKVDRKYYERWKVLTRNNFDPLMDIKKDCHNLLILEGNKPQLRDDLRHYFRTRNEDNIDAKQKVFRCT